MAAKTRAQLNTAVATLLADNSTNNISATDVQDVFEDIVESSDNLLDDATTAKGTPVDADTVRIIDSEASGARKILTFANLKAWIITAFGALLTTISGKTTPVNADLLVLSDSEASNATKYLTWANLKTVVFAALGPLIAATTSKATPVDADSVLIHDSAASDVNKRVTWANIKATILAAFRVHGTPVATTSGSEAAFTGIPAGVNRIVISVSGYSTNGTAVPQLLLGDTDGYETTSYVGTVTAISNGASPATAAFSTGFDLAPAWTASINLRGKIELVRHASGAHAWTLSGAFGRSDAAVTHTLSGAKTLSAELDRVKFITTDTQDAGSVNVLYYF